MYNPYSLQGKTILITGASSGIGRSVAVECAKMGATVVATGRDKGRLGETLNMLEGKGHFQIVADLSDFTEIQALIDKCPNVDGISHNAGIANILALKYVTPDKLQTLVGINTFGPILLTQMMVKNKKINKDGSIVFTSSLSGVYCVHYGESMYAASKGAISAFAKSAALELASRGIRVNCVNPSIIQTNIFKNEGGTMSEEQMKEKIQNYPLKRLGETTDVSWAHVFFLSDASSWITGVNLPIDGGYILI
ncbi:MAG: SDR family oxidoreductase [Prevotella sp.]|nr:SDR family oxidoreductase [Prevotella sp.]